MACRNEGGGAPKMRGRPKEGEGAATDPRPRQTKGEGRWLVAMRVWVRPRSEGDQTGGWGGTTDPRPRLAGWHFPSATIGWGPYGGKGACHNGDGRRVNPGPRSEAPPPEKEPNQRGGRDTSSYLA